jgi:Na+/H+-dicarboxylate symporter
MKLTKSIIISLLFGIIFGGLVRNILHYDNYTNNLLDSLSLISEIFINLIKMIVAPLIFTTLTLGIINIGNSAKGVGKLFIKCLVFFLISSLLSLSIGWIIVDLFKPGLEMSKYAHDLIGVVNKNNTGLNFNGISLINFVRDMVPSNIMGAFTGNHIIQIVIFSILLGFALNSMNIQDVDIIKRLLNAIMNAMFIICNFVMKLVPLAIFASISHVIIKNGFGVLYTYLLFILEYYIALIIVWLSLYLLSLKIVGKSIHKLLIKIFPALALSFVTTSSEVAYPSILKELDNFGVKNKISSFVLPLGYSFNMIGSMVYFSFAMIFLVQVFAIKISFYQQLYIFFVLLITSKGIAGVPRASIMVIASAVSIFQFPAASILLLLPIDSFADMGRSATNVFANALTSTFIDKWQKDKE